MVNPRQSLMHKEHFIQLISFLKSELDLFDNKLTEALDSDHRVSVMEGKVEIRRDILILSFTSGLTFSDIEREYNCYLDDLIKTTDQYQTKKSFAPDNILEQYIQCTWILSFAYFFNAEKSEVEKIIPHIPYTGKDKLIDRLIAAIIPEHPVSQDIAFPDVYKPICDAMGVYDKDARDVLVQLFLKKYYPSLKKHDVTWYDSHKEKDPEYNFHTGYWVFELAAIAVAIGWDDTDFRDNMYYPKDLADWKREQLKLATMES